MTNQKINWTGQSGQKYTYYIHPITTFTDDSPGNYIFAKKTEAGQWRPVYIGQTKSLKDRLADHEKADCARKNGATHIHVHLSGGEDARRKEESDLIANYQPVCNTVGVRPR